MRAIPDSMDAEIVAAIDERIAALETEDGIRIAWVIESGSRAWGFPSPDSDYDCRFFYVRPTGDYLSPWPRRDVIETPLDKIFDVNGWDVAKALRLLVKGNGVVTEWLRSPIIYRGDVEFRDSFLELAESVMDRNLVAHHYSHLGRRQLEISEQSLKKFFYALRPAAILRWMRTNPAETVPPMELMPALLQGDAPADVVSLTAELIELKSRTREMGAGEVPTVLRRFVEDEYEKAAIFDGAKERRTNIAEAQARCDEFFVRVLG